MNVRQLEIFSVLMTSRSITEAATQLCVSQPAVSKALRLMELELGITLFDRKHGHLQPSPEAQRLYPETKKILKDLDSMHRFAGDLRYGSSGQIRITVAPTVTSSFLGPAVSRFHRSRPNVRIAVKTMMTRDVVNMVAGHEVELGFGPAPAKDIDSRAIALCETTDLCESEIVLVLPEGHALAERRSANPRNIEDFSLISFPQDTPTGLVLKESFRAADVPYNVAIEANQTSTICSLVRAGSGIALINSLALISDDFPDLIIKPFRPRVPVRSCVYTSRYKPLSNMATEFRRQMRETVAELASTARYPIRVL